jgi:hypothetical protein
VGAEHLAAERHGVGGALCPPRLYTVCLPRTMHQGQEGAAHPGTTSAGTLGGAANCATTADDRSIPTPICCPRRNRRHSRASHPPVWRTAESLQWTSENLSAACHHRHRAQHRAGSGMAREDPSCQHTTVSLCCPGGVGVWRASAMCNGLQSIRAGPAITVCSGPHDLQLSPESGPHSVPVRLLSPDRACNQWVGDYIICDYPGRGGLDRAGDGIQGRCDRG